MTLSKHHKMMVADGFPPSLILTKEERDAAWEENPPKAVSWSTLEAQENRRREAELRRTSEKLSATKPAIKKASPPMVEPADRTGMKWSLRATKVNGIPAAGWIPDPDYKPEKKAAKKAPSSSDLSAIKSQFKVKVGTNKEKLLTVLVEKSAAPVSPEDLAMAVYGEAGHVGALAGVIKGLQVAIESGKLRWIIERTERGYQLHED